MRGKDHCSAHRPGGIKGAGAPPGNRNAETHGMYSTILREDEFELIPLSLADDLDDELFMARVFTRRVATRATEDIDTDQLLTYYNALLRGAGRIANLLRQRQALSPEATTFSSILAEVLEELDLSHGNPDQNSFEESPD